MVWEEVFYISASIIGILISLGVARYAWQHRSVPGAEYFALYNLCAVQWALSSILAVVAANPDLQDFWGLFSMIGIFLNPVMWLAFTLEYTGRERPLTVRTLTLIAIVPVIALLLIESAGVYQLARGLEIADSSSWAIFVVLIASVYVAALLLFSTLFIIQELLRARRRYRGRYITLLVGVWAPWVFGVMALFGLNEFSGQLLPVGYAIGSLVAAWGIFRYQVFDIMPIALDTVIESIGDGVIVLDTQDRIVDLNPAAQTIVNLSAKRATGLFIDQALGDWEELKQRLDRGQRQAVTDGKAPVRSRKDAAQANVIQGPDEGHYELRVSRLVDRYEALSGRLILLHDISARVQVEDELREAKAVAEAARLGAESANRAKSIFLANMSHELRTPLNAILGFARLMTRDQGLTAEQRENLETIGRSGEHLLGLINDVLELSKIEAGRVALQKESFDLHRLLDGLEEMFHLRAAEKSLMLIFDRTPDVPQYVRTDEAKLRQVLMNLLGNAVKFTQEGGATLRIGYSNHPGSFKKEATAGEPRESFQEGGPRLLFEVEDTGPGIAPQELDAVFDPFKQTASGQMSHEGTGLGMPISRQFVRLMGGDLTFTSELGVGSLFRFDVQIELADAADVPSAKPARRVIGLEPDQRAVDGGPYRLLVVEDREPSRRLLVKLLTDLGPPPLGFELREAANGQEAIEIWQHWKAHLIWMDMRMPVMDGHEATQRIKATTQGQATVIVALTASAFESDRAMILSGGCDDYVRKPFREEEIFDMLAKHLGVRFVYEEGAQPIGVTAEASAGFLSTAALAALPGDWVTSLHQAATQLDADLILALLDRIREQNSPLADALESLVHDFRFDVILNLTAPTEDGNE